MLIVRPSVRSNVCMSRLNAQGHSRGIVLDNGRVCIVCDVQCIHSVLIANTKQCVYAIQCRVHILQCNVHMLQCNVHMLQCNVHMLQCTLRMSYSVQSA